MLNTQQKKNILKHNDMEGYERIFPHVGGRDIEAWTQRNLLEHNIYHFPPSNMYHYREEVFIP